MQFEPLSERDVLNLIEPGEYDFLVKFAEDTKSKSGNDMVKLTIAVWDNNNVERQIFDYLMPQLMYKVKHFADSVGLENEYAKGGYAASQCINRSGRCKVIIDEPKPDSPYSPKNAIKDYVARDKTQPAKTFTPPAKPAGDPGFSDEDLPF